MKKGEPLWNYSGAVWRRTKGLGDCIPVPRPRAVESEPLWHPLLSCLMHSIPQNPFSSFVAQAEEAEWKRLGCIQSTQIALERQYWGGRKRRAGKVKKKTLGETVGFYPSPKNRFIHLKVHLHLHLGLGNLQLCQWSGNQGGVHIWHLVIMNQARLD